ncbi:putative aminotransferase-like, plant mobile domain-containing protein [Medicago truncatula]|uniref:Putative aminotransferase-like, plant mobile domain-containing protein n=2 Tax=Medicago truncatula TaxID=3880 RepID=A0A396IMW2_MEDTR|nr:putative aminotransferase-like, plant mobile domain-containing protein [Medicago truncatula]
MLINHEDPLLFRWHKVQALKIDNVMVALDSAIDDFLWRPYFRYADKCDLFYPNDAFFVPFKKDLDKQMLSFVICLRVSELVGFDSIEQYLPHRVAMQFGMDQDVPGDVPRFNETKITAWKYYCRLISDKNLYFPPRLFEADVATRYAMWWKQSVLGHRDFVKNIVKRKRSESSRKHRPHLGKTNRSSNDVGVPPGFCPNLVDLLKYGKFCDDAPAGSSAHVCTTADENIDAPSMSVEDSKPVLKSKHLVNHCSSSSLSDFELSTESLEEHFEDANGSKEVRMTSDRVCLSETQAESKQFSIRKKVSLSNNVAVAQKNLQFHYGISTQAQSKEEVEVKRRKESDHEALVFLKEQYLKNQEELRLLARQQDEMLRLMDLKMKRDEELRQLLTSFLKNQPPPSSS